MDTLSVQTISRVCDLKTNRPKLHYGGQLTYVFKSTYICLKLNDCLPSLSFYVQSKGQLQCTNKFIYCIGHGIYCEFINVHKINHLSTIPWPASLQPNKLSAFVFYFIV